MLQEVAEGVTVVVVAHRLSTVRNCDRLAYMDEGSVRACGDFDFLRASVPEFDAQARLAGL